MNASKFSTNSYEWSIEFQKIHDAACARYKEGCRGADVLSAPQIAFLQSIGCRPIEFYDFIDDFLRYGEPGFSTALLVASARRDYFLYEQEGEWCGERGNIDDLPAKTAAVAGFTWLPRIIEKAKWKLRGQMGDDLMFGCGGDRDFLRRAGIHPADFLRFVWSAGDDDEKTIRWVAERHPEGAEDVAD